MIHSKFFIFSLLFLIFSISVVQYASGIELASYYEDVDGTPSCTSFGTLAGDTSIGLNVTDGVEFDFIQDQSYLLVVTTDWGGTITVNEYAVRVLHNATVFEGSENIMEPVVATNGCSFNNDFYRYFWFTVWTPSTPTEASEDIRVEFETLDGSAMEYDNIAVSVINLDDTIITENTDWFFDEVLTDTTLATSFGTLNNATLSFTPAINNTDWLVMGSNQLDTGTATVNFETRLFVNGTETDFPLISQEGEDPVDELFVQTFARGLTLQNTTQILQTQAQVDATASGTNERLYSSLFALNIDIFDEQIFSWIEPEADISQTEYGTNVLNNTFTPPINGTNVFILADFGTKDTGATLIEARVQLDNVDTLEGNTAESYDYNAQWDGSDILRWSQGGIFDVNNTTHTVDVDASQTGTSDPETIYSSLIIFSLNKADFVKNFTDQMSWIDDIRLDITKNVTDSMTMPDDIRLDITKNVTDSMTMPDFINATITTFKDDPMSMLDDIRLDIVNTPDDNMSWLDDIRLDITKNVTDSMTMPDESDPMVTILFDDAMSILDDIRLDIVNTPDDNMSWLDDIRLDLVKNFTDPMSMIDQVDPMITLNFTDPMSMIDDTRLDLLKNFTDPMSWIDDIRLDLVKNFTDPMSMIDQIDPMITLNFTDPMSMIDDTRLDLLKNFTDPMSMTDFINATTTTFKDDPISFTDVINTFSTFGQPVIDVTVTGGGVGGRPTPTIPDSDLDGIPDPEDACPLEPETFNGFQDADGCPDSLEKPEPITIFDLGFPFGFNELDVIDDFISLETDSPQPQVEDLGIRWLGDEPITITAIEIGGSPFEFQIQDIPLTFGNNRFGYTSAQVIYTIQEPNKICGNVLTSDCVDEVTYKIPVVVTGEVRGKIVIANGNITVDNANRFNPYWIVIIVLILIPIVAFFLWWKNKKSKAKPKTKTLLKLTQATRTKKLVVTRSKPLKSGTTRKLLTESEKTNILGKKTK